MSESHSGVRQSVLLPCAPEATSHSTANFTRRFGLKARLVLLVFCAFVPVSLTYILLVWNSARQAIAAGEQELVLVAREAIEKHGDLVESARDVLTVLALPGVGNKPTCVARLTAAQKSFHWLASVVALNPDGKPICASQVLPSMFALTETEAFRGAVKSGKFTVGGLTKGAITGKPVVNMALPAFDLTGTLEGVLIAAVRARSFEAAVRAGSTPLDAEVLLFDKFGSLLTDVARRPNALPISVLFQAAVARGQLGEKTGVIEGKMIEGNDPGYIFAYGIYPDSEGLLILGIPREPLLAEVQQAAKYWGWGLAASIGFGVALAWIAAEILVLRSARRLLSATDALVNGSNHVADPLPSAPCELGELSSHFSQMFAAIQKRERQMIQAIKEADAARRAESSFLAKLSHELRTPLNAILGFSEVIRDQAVGQGVSQRYREYAADIYNSGQHLLLLIGDLLDVSRARVPEAISRTEQVNIGDEIESAAHSFQIEAEAKNVDVICDIERNLPPIATNQRMVRQILLNLISNAVKYTPDGGRVSLSASLNGEHIRIEISDNGVGFSDKQVKKAFEPFGRAIENPYVATSEGTGLGLYITRELVTALKGTVEIGSVEGQGTTVTVLLPIA